MRNFYSLSLAVLFAATTYGVALADDPQTYALDKLANAQAQLDQLQAQQKALDKLARAVKQDLKAAKIRAKAERVQLSADTARQDAAVLVEQSGVAVDLPNLMAARAVEGGILEYKGTDTSKMTTIGKSASIEKKTEESEVFFPSNNNKKTDSKYSTQEDIGYIK